MRCHTALEVAGLTSYAPWRPSSSRSSVSACRGGPRSTIFDLPCLELNRWKESGWDITAGSAVANDRTSSFPAKATEFMFASGARPSQRASGKPSRTWTKFSGLCASRTFRKKNVVRLEQMVKSENPHVARLAAMVLRVARVKPYRTRRLKFLAQKHPELLRELEDTGLVLSHGWESAELSGKENSEGTEISFGEDSETIELSVQDDWAIPF